MTTGKVSADEFATWIFASDAVQKLGVVYGSRVIAITTLLTRLSVGLLPAVAEHAVITEYHKSPVSGSLAIVPPAFWKELKELEIGHANTLWSANDIDANIEDKIKDISLSDGRNINISIFRSVSTQ